MAAKIRLGATLVFSFICHNQAKKLAQLRQSVLSGYDSRRKIYNGDEILID